MKMLCFFAKCHEVAIEIEIGDVGAWIGRIADDDGNRLRDRMLEGAFKCREEGRCRLSRHGAHDAARHQEAESVNWIGRVRHQHDVAWRGYGLRHIGEAFLRAQRCHDLSLGLQFDAEAALIIRRLRFE